MKKTILFAAVIGTFVVSIASFASSARESKEVWESTSTSVTGRGACRHSGCRCTWFTSAGNGGKCVCGHWDYVHN